MVQMHHLGGWTEGCAEGYAELHGGAQSCPKVWTEVRRGAQRDAWSCMEGCTRCADGCAEVCGGFSEVGYL